MIQKSYHIFNKFKNFFWKYKPQVFQVSVSTKVSKKLQPSFTYQHKNAIVSPPPTLFLVSCLSRNLEELATRKPKLICFEAQINFLSRGSIYFMQTCSQEEYISSFLFSYKKVMHLMCLKWFTQGRYILFLINFH